jgi:SOS-response transcriptional repressor LexA
MALGARVRQRRTELGFSQGELSAKVGHKISQVGISNLESRDSGSSRFSAELAIALKVNRNWLEKGRAPKSIDANTEGAHALEGKVPLISWVQAGTWQPAADPFQPGEGEPVDSPLAVKEGMYALTVRGDSMFNPMGPKSYPDGCRIFVNPAMRNPNNGDRVIAKIDGEDEVTFKVFVKDGSRVFLRPLNPQYPVITDRFRVLGTVVAKVELE